MGKRIGYARVSTVEQNISSQIAELKAAGCTEIFTDKAKGTKTERPGLEKCLKSLRSGDILVVWRLDRLGRSMLHLVSVMTQLKSCGIGFKSLKDGAIDTSTASGELIFNIFSALAQFERELIRERTQVGLNAARARGRKGGRKSISPDDPRVSLAKKMYKNKNISIEEICSTLNISRATFYRYLNLH